MSVLLAALSWVAVLAGFGGSWLAGRSHKGWLLGVLCCLLWLLFNVYYGIWAGAFGATVGAAINIRNYRIGRGMTWTTKTSDLACIVSAPTHMTSSSIPPRA